MKNMFISFTINNLFFLLRKIFLPVFLNNRLDTMCYTKTLAAGFSLIKKNIVVGVGYMNSISMYIQKQIDVFISKHALSD